MDNTLQTSLLGKQFANCKGDIVKIVACWLDQGRLKVLAVYHEGNQTIIHLPDIDWNMCRE